LYQTNKQTNILVRFRAFMRKLELVDLGRRSLYSAETTKAIATSPAAAFWQAIETLTKGKSLWYLLQDTRDLECTDSRDRVYAILALADSGKEGIKPDYDRPGIDLYNDILRNWYRDSRPRTIEQYLSERDSLPAIFGITGHSLYGFAPPNIMDLADWAEGSRNAKFNPGMIHAHEAVSHPGDVYRWARLFGHEGIICLLEQQYGQADLLIEMYKER
jgi:hypothetical protein